MAGKGSKMTFHELMKLQQELYQEMQMGSASNKLIKYALEKALKDTTKQMLAILDETPDNPPVTKPEVDPQSTQLPSPASRNSSNIGSNTNSPQTRLVNSVQDHGDSADSITRHRVNTVDDITQRLRRSSVQPPLREPTSPTDEAEVRHQDQTSNSERDSIAANADFVAIKREEDSGIIISNEDDGLRGDAGGNARPSNSPSVAALFQIDTRPNRQVLNSQQNPLQVTARCTCAYIKVERTCWYYAQGCCKFGAGCRDAHDEEGEDVRLRKDRDHKDHCAEMKRARATRNKNHLSSARSAGYKRSFDQVNADDGEEDKEGGFGRGEVKLSRNS